MSTLKKVILLENVKKLGIRGSVVNVKRGYARNALIPQKQAVYANAANMAELQKNMAIIEKKNAESLMQAKEKASLIEKIKLSIACKANATDGKLFGSVTVRNIVKELSKNNIEVKSRDIVVVPIKKIGEYNMEIILHPEITVRLPLSVVSLQNDTPI